MFFITLFEGEQGLQGAPGDDGMKGIKVSGSFVILNRQILLILNA